MKKILYLTFYFEPDLCAGSFRNSPLVKELAKQVKGIASVDVITTLPNRYITFDATAPEFEERDNYTVRRIAIPAHKSGMKDQVFSFKAYYDKVREHVRGIKYDLVVASSSRLFTAYLGYTIARRLEVPLYLDIRDIFYDTMEDVLQSGLLKKMVLPAVKLVEKRTLGYAKHINLISGGFRPYFEQYKSANYSQYPNGVDDIFIEANEGWLPYKKERDFRTIVYAGNIGEGQGLHKIIPQAAKALGNKFRFLIIGDGGARQKLVEEIERLEVGNVELRNPVKRDELIKIYQEEDFLFVHLNNYRAFEKVLPSKIFELATFSKPLLAGVGGFSGSFIKENIENALLFEPCNVNQLVDTLRKYDYREVKRTSFIESFRREAINEAMASTMVSYL